MTRRPSRRRAAVLTSVVLTASLVLAACGSRVAPETVNILAGGSAGAGQSGAGDGLGSGEDLGVSGPGDATGGGAEIAGGSSGGGDTGSATEGSGSSGGA
ncbi:MAG: hypothetical protein Q8Q02_16810, partial [Nocardioides sp.]|nr:hypothetical protein [Nocardioides sp.]